MLKELHIENFAIIENITLILKDGLTTFTGETGAGKSILLDALDALVGGRAETTMIRADTDRSLLEANFLIPNQHKNIIHKILDREGLLDNPEELLLSREIRREGRNIARINGRTVNVSLLREIGRYLVDIHGQSEHLSLLTIREHCGLLDRYANNNTIKQAFHHTFLELKKVQMELESQRQSEQDAARKTDLLTYQIQEIEAAKIQPGEEPNLRTELKRLANAEKLASLATKAYALLEDDNPETPTITDMFGVVLEALMNLATIDEEMKKVAEQGETASATIADIALSLNDYLATIEYNPKRLDQIETRLALLSTLKKKYGSDENSILAFAENAREELEKISHAEEKIAFLEQQENQLKHQLADQALTLSISRKQAAAAIEKAIETELADLKMLGAKFAVSFKYRLDENGLPIDENKHVAFDATGIDQIEFMIAPNLGEGLKPLVKIASGGETSRLMLALKNVLTHADTIPTLIFDEIDQGIGGRIGAIVGSKLWKLGQNHQVLCITHLPQLAAFGDAHFHVYKHIDAGRTQTTVELLSHENRLAELALMFGGVNDANRAAAAESLRTASQFKKD